MYLLWAFLVCRVRLLCCVKTFAHIPHEIVEPSWIFECLFRSRLCVYTFPHVIQLNIFTIFSQNLTNKRLEIRAGPLLRR